MRHSAFVTVLLPLISFAIIGCSGGPQVNQSVLSAASSRGVATTTQQKMSAARPLDFLDLQNLIAKGVPSQTIVAYLSSIQQSFNLTPQQLASLKSAGASPELTAYLVDSRRFYASGAASPRNQSSKHPSGAYYNTPGYQNEQPFAYNEPAIDGFYNSGYEESLYSPFSFN
jgi:hypothetical protein